MSTAPSNISVGSITQYTARVQWQVNGSDTNYSDYMIVDSSGQTVKQVNNIHTPNSQYYSDTVMGLTAGTSYHGYIRTKQDQAGNGDSGWIYFPDFTTKPDVSGNPATDTEVQQKVYAKTNIAGYFFDAVLQTNYTRSLTITSHPVETGAAISDHAYVNPVELIMNIGMSDVMTSIIQGQFTQGSSRSLTAFQVLAQLQAQRIPMNVFCRLGSFKNMLIETIAVPDDYTTMNGLKATITMKEVFVASVKTVRVSARPHVTDSTNRGVVVPQPITDQSVALLVEKLVKGYIDKYLGPNGGLQ